MDGIFLSDLEQGEIGPDLYRHACLMGPEGIVSKHRDRPYRSDRSPNWIKVKNRKHPAMHRVMEAFSSYALDPVKPLHGPARDETEGPSREAIFPAS